jgi:hypothetical protein
MVIELGGSVFEITHDLVGDLFRAKNAGVTQTILTRSIMEAELAALDTSIIEVECLHELVMDLPIVEKTDTGNHNEL